jgi:hypothetical protein
MKNLRNLKYLTIHDEPQGTRGDPDLAAGGQLGTEHSTRIPEYDGTQGARGGPDRDGMAHNLMAARRAQGVILTSPLVVNIGMSLTIPLAFVADQVAPSSSYYFMHYSRA